MKFGKRLRTQVDETLPEWRDNFISYKDLKKRLKGLSAPECFTEAAVENSAANGDCDKSVVDMLQHELIESGDPGKLGMMLLGPKASKRGPHHGESSDTQKQEVERREAGLQSLSTSLMASGWSRRVWKGKDLTEIAVKEVAGAADDDSNATPEEGAFIQMLYSELEKFNNFFIEKEEEFVIRLQDLKERVDNLRTKCKDEEVAVCGECCDDVNEVRKAIVTFHGEMVLLENYSLLNYMGLCKILKKHDKRTGMLLRHPFINDVLRQPFYMTELLSKLVRECEEKLQVVFPKNVFRFGEERAEAQPAENSAVSGGDEQPVETSVLADLPTASMADEEVDNIYRSTLAALRSLQEIRGGTSAQANGVNGGDAMPLHVTAGTAACCGCPAS
eukprot:TRINITY_DN625_c0_g2_i1.p1 TRINITY_DN625_c0_g2~~TRINITY_DN625_c0_g2_i1.p1  ORF type:complete len:389 (+),score=103.59 TRINITY_DN625_c0_g2_i1:325-1491(+)